MLALGEGHEVHVEANDWNESGLAPGLEQLSRDLARLRLGSPARETFGEIGRSKPTEPDDTRGHSWKLVSRSQSPERPMIGIRAGGRRMGRTS